MTRMKNLTVFAAALGLSLAAVLAAPAARAEDASLQSIGRFDGWRDNALVGYGLVVGLAGSGDSRRNVVTRQALSNVLQRLGTAVTEEDISSRNVAVVIVAGTLPPSANSGDRISVTVSSIGDARSLSGGTLLMTPLLGPDRRPYALAQGALVTGGSFFESGQESQQRNYPTTARLENGATIEAPVDAKLAINNGQIGFLLNEPNFTTATRIADRINQALGAGRAIVHNADEVRIRIDGHENTLPALAASIESLTVSPSRLPRIVINERTGTVVAGGDVTIGSVVVSQGDVRVTVKSDAYASQPSFIGGLANDVASLVVTNEDLFVDADRGDAVASFPSTTVADLITGLSKLGVDTRRMISILQAIKGAGALNAEIIVQ